MLPPMVLTPSTSDLQQAAVSNSCPPSRDIADRAHVQCSKLWVRYLPGPEQDEKVAKRVRIVPLLFHGAQHQEGLEAPVVQVVQVD
mmetsp:Transcript_32895/g.63723  ORF Transcript_32895/g.63723 Transcript_32895/m.63723 type:complete len:86 (+) Transcript_32895:1151-1408(+)